MATGGSNQKTKMHMTFEIQFQVESVLYKISKMAWHNLVAPMTTDLLHFRKKDKVQARAYMGDWVGILPTQKLLDTKLASPENFVQIHSPV